MTPALKHYEALLRDQLSAQRAGDFGLEDEILGRMDAVWLRLDAEGRAQAQQLAIAATSEC